MSRKSKLACSILLFVASLQLSFSSSVTIPTNLIRIRGSGLAQSLPVSAIKSWKTWTFEDSCLCRVDDMFSDEELQENLGWVDPVSLDDLYLPSDIPMPKARPAVAVAIVNGSPRYIMPSVVLSLETPSKSWRNRGLCTLPRAHSWIDLYTEFAPKIKNLRLYSYGQMTKDLRFLEDQVKK